jgi:hypothetical protein
VEINKDKIVPTKNAKHSKNINDRMMQCIKLVMLWDKEPKYLGMPCTHSLGESTPPQGVNGLILSYPYLFDPRSRVVGLVQYIQSAQDTLHHA